MKTLIATLVALSVTGAAAIVADHTTHAKATLIQPLSHCSNCGYQHGDTAILRAGGSWNENAEPALQY